MRMPESFGDAHDLFDAVRAASYELWRHDAKYNAMERRALSMGHGVRMASAVAPSDRMSPVDAMVDFEAMMERSVARWCETVDAGMAVLYGHDWEHGIAKSLGLGYAEVLELVYVQRLTVRETSKRTRFSERTVRRMKARALAYIDAIGMDGATAGE